MREGSFRVEFMPGFLDSMSRAPVHFMAWVLSMLPLRFSPKHRTFTNNFGWVFTSFVAVHGQVSRLTETYFAGCMKGLKTGNCRSRARQLSVTLRLHDSCHMQSL